MSAPALPAELNDAVRDFLTRYLDNDARAREYTIREAVYGTDLPDTLQWGTAKATFVRELMAAALNYGNLSDETPVLCAIVTGTARNLGPNRQAEAAQLRERINAALAAESPALAPALPAQTNAPETISTASTSAAPASSPVTVFLSYKTGTSAWNRKVLEFAARLRGDGITSIVDQAAGSMGGMSIPMWSEQQVRDADYTLLLVSPDYRRVWDGTMPAGSGLGAATEVAMVRNRVYADGQRNERHIAVLLGDETPTSIPEILSTFPYFNDGTAYDMLLQRLFGVAPVVLPDVGARKVKPSVTFTSNP